MPQFSASPLSLTPNQFYARLQIAAGNVQDLILLWKDQQLPAQQPSVVTSGHIGRPSRDKPQRSRQNKLLIMQMAENLEASYRTRTLLRLRWQMSASLRLSSRGRDETRQDKTIKTSKTGKTGKHKTGTERQAITTCHQ